MEIVGTVVREITEVMGPEGKPLPGHVLAVYVTAPGMATALRFTGAGLIKLHAMLDPWVRALQMEVDEPDGD